ncbi:MAG: hemolysin III family protein, partial [Kiritimatiellaceae bacterium]|nr:hemolysin III family protein [Kiritimatiellaceae bacterium]
MLKSEPYRADEELAHSITHGIGFVIGIAVLVVLVAFSAMHKSAWEVVSCSIYGATFIMLYLGSTLYHAVTHPRVKAVLKVIDHSAIYLLIAGTYTPYALVPLRGALGWSIFGAIWGAALIGIFFKAFFSGRFKWVSLGSYLFMGWFCVIA